MSCGRPTSKLPGESAAGKGLAAVVGLHPALCQPRIAVVLLDRHPPRIQRPCSASILPPHAPPVLGRSLSVSQAVGRAASSLTPLRSSVRLRLVYTRPLFLHTSAGVNPARSVPGSREAAVPAAGADSAGTSPPQTSPKPQCKAAYAAAAGFRVDIRSIFGQHRNNLL